MPSAITRYEQRIAQLEKEKLLMEESIYSTPPQGRFEELFEHAMSFLSNPYKLWTLGQLAHKRTVLKLAFLDRLTTKRKTGLQTPLIALPFKVLDNLNGANLKMVEDRRLELLTPCLQSRCATNCANPPKKKIYLSSVYYYNISKRFKIKLFFRKIFYVKKALSGT